MAQTAAPPISARYSIPATAWSTTVGCDNGSVHVFDNDLPIVGRLRFAVEPAGEGSAFTPIPGVDLDEILYVQEERQVGNDNCIAYRTLKLQIPESPMRPHFVKARVKVRVYPDGSHALFHGPRCIGRYDDKGRLRTTDDARRAA
jgi:hypothetical protein